jgi:hypothetical protein
MFEDGLRPAVETAYTLAPIALVAIWALLGVIAAVILIRLREDDFGLRVGAALFAIGAAGLVLLGASVQPEAPQHLKVDQVNAESKLIRVVRN